jgi:glycosyltransferase involved in cell wall biosynthesis
MNTSGAALVPEALQFVMNESFERNTTMKIAMISTPFLSVPPKDYGGTELLVHELVEGLVERGHDVTLFATGDSRTSGRLEALYLQAQWPPGMLTDLNHVSWAMEQVAGGDYDLVHAHSAVALGLGRLVPHVPLVYTIHHDREPELSGFYRQCQDACYVAISNDQIKREVCLRHSQVIHHGLNPLRYQWRAKPEGDYVCFVGRFAQVKGPHTAIEVARMAGVPIRVAGDIHPPDREFVGREVLPRLDLPHVTYLSCIGMDKKVPLLRDARALLAPIEWNEPFGLIYIEAMLSGCPVVAFGRGSIPELVEQGITGFKVDSPEEMAEVIRPGGALDQFDRKQCRERAVARFSRERLVEDHERLYRSLLRQKRQISPVSPAMVAV